MELKDIVIAMNTKTWEELRVGSIETANYHEDPISYLSQWALIDVAIDEGVPDGIVETYDKAFIKDGGINWKKL